MGDNNNSRYKQISQLEHNFDLLIQNTNRNESISSPISYKGHFLQNIKEWEKLKDNPNQYIQKEYADYQYGGTPVVDSSVFLNNINKLNNKSNGYKSGNGYNNGTPFRKSNFNFNINSNNNNNNNNNNKFINSQDNQTNILNLRNNNGIDYINNPILSNYNNRSNNNNYNNNYNQGQSHNKIADKLEPIVNEIRKKLELKKQFMDGISRIQSPNSPYSYLYKENQYYKNNDRNIDNREISENPNVMNSMKIKTPNTVAITSGKGNNVVLLNSNKESLSKKDESDYMQVNNNQ